MESAHEAQQNAPTRRARTRPKRPPTPLTCDAPSLFGVDGRSRQARRFREIYCELVSELGRRPTPAEGARLVDAATLIMASEDVLTRAAAGERGAAGEQLKISYALRHALDSLGLGRVRR